MNQGRKDKRNGTSQQTAHQTDDLVEGVHCAYGHNRQTNHHETAEKITRGPETRTATTGIAFLSARGARLARLDGARGDFERREVLEGKRENDGHRIGQLDGGRQIRVWQRGGEHRADRVAKGHPTGNAKKGEKANDGENDALVNDGKGGALFFRADGFLQWHQERDGAFEQQDLVITID